MVSEDIGLANPELPSQINSLFNIYTELKAWKNANHPERLQIVHAVLLMARSPKSRMLDHACHVAYTTNETIPMPDYALCMHTGRGRQQGRGLDHWYSDAATLVNGLDLDDKWEVKSRELAYEPPKAKPAEKRKRIMLAMRPDIHEKLRKIATRRNLSMSRTIEMLILEASK